MNEIEKAKFSEEIVGKTIKKLIGENIRVHSSSDFSKDGYSIILGIFIPFPSNYLTNERIDKLKLILEEENE